MEREACRIGQAEKGCERGLRIDILRGCEAGQLIYTAAGRTHRLDDTAVGFFGAPSKRTVEPQCERAYRRVALRRDEGDLLAQSIVCTRGAWIAGCVDIIAAPNIATTDEIACGFDLFGRFRNGNPQDACTDRRDAMSAAERIAFRSVGSEGRVDASDDRATYTGLRIANDHDRDFRQRDDNTSGVRADANRGTLCCGIMTTGDLLEKGQRRRTRSWRKQLARTLRTPNSMQTATARRLGRCNVARLSSLVRVAYANVDPSWLSRDAPEIIVVKSGPWRVLVP
jgi:hypothetical protein